MLLKYIHTIAKHLSNGKLLYNPGSPDGALWWARRAGFGVGERETQEGEDICIYIPIYIVIYKTSVYTVFYSRDQHSIVKQLSSN